MDLETTLFIKILVFSVLTITTGLSHAYSQSNSDSIYCASALHKGVLLTCRAGEVLYAVGIDDSTCVYRIINHKSKKIAVGPSTKITALALTPNNNVFLGTEHSFAYVIKRDKAIRFDYKDGLCDSTVLKTEYAQQGRLIVKAPSNNFVFDEQNIIRKSKFIPLEKQNTPRPKNNSLVKRGIHEPINRAICFLFGDIDLSFKASKAIRPKELNEIKKRLHPGDILIKRNDLQVSNVGIPGFWTHSGIYLGSLQMLDDYFAGIPQTKGLKPSEYIKFYHYEAYRKLVNKKHLIIEAVGEGVSINKLEHIAKVDHFAGLRPQLSREQTFNALMTALGYFNYPYDYLFDFSDDGEVFCSELVYRAFGKTATQDGIEFKTGTRNDQLFLFPNNFAEQFCDEAHLPQKHLDLVVFCTIGPDEKRASLKDSEHFAKIIGRSIADKKE
jgi:hypothetical protein